jgi:hypothetical protein
VPEQYKGWVPSHFARLSTALKMFLILSFGLLPLGADCDPRFPAERTRQCSGASPGGRGTGPAQGPADQQRASAQRTHHKSRRHADPPVAERTAHLPGDAPSAGALPGRAGPLCALCRQGRSGLRQCRLRSARHRRASSRRPRGDRGHARSGGTPLRFLRRAGQSRRRRRASSRDACPHHRIAGHPHRV